jgi:hypothetical protein
MRFAHKKEQHGLPIFKPEKRKDKGATWASHFKPKKRKDKGSTWARLAEIIVIHWSLILEIRYLL